MIFIIRFYYLKLVVQEIKTITGSMQYFSLEKQSKYSPINPIV